MILKIRSHFRIKGELESYLEYSQWLSHFLFLSKINKQNTTKSYTSDYAFQMQNIFLLHL